MMDPNDGAMRTLDTAALVALKAEMEGRNIPIEQAAVEAYPGQVLWREGEEIEVRGCWFRVSAVRRTRVTLVPIARPR